MTRKRTKKKAKKWAAWNVVHDAHGRDHQSNSIYTLKRHAAQLGAIDALLMGFRGQ